VTTPQSLPTQAEFYEQNEARRGSHVLSYGSSWQQPGWTDDSHKIELMWIKATNELVAFYITYDWDRLSPGAVAIDTVAASAFDVFVDSGYGVGRTLADMDLATADVEVELIATLDSDRACHELLWGWHWWQHHADGLDHVRARARERDLTA
jgi:hypothetical protein